MFGPKRIFRYILMAAMILAGVSFIALMMSNFDVTADKIVSELVAIFILLAILVGAACLTALGLRTFRDRHDKQN